jgi:serine/threonine-protein kinase RsbW
MRGQSASSEHPLLPVVRSLAEQTFQLADIPAVRRAAAVSGARAGMGTAKTADFVQAVSEAAACALGQGPCTARLRLWTTGRRAFCEISGDGMLVTDGPWHARQGDAGKLRRWLLQQLCDHVSVESGPQGVTVRLAMSVA